MAKYIDKSALVAEIEKRRDKNARNKLNLAASFEDNYLLSFLDTLEVKDPYEQYIQYSSIKDGIEAHAETYSFNIESELFNQLTKEQQNLWRKEIEQAVISGGDTGVALARDQRYKENLKVKEINTWHLQKNEDIYDAVKDWSLYSFVCLMDDGSIQKFTGIRDECADGSINIHIDAIDDKYDTDNIIFWIETPL